MTTSAVRRWLVIFPGALGDFLCFLPTLEFLRQGNEVDLLAHSEFADLAPSNVRVGSLERYEIQRLFVPGSAQEKRLRDFFGSYSSIFSWSGHGQSTFVQELNEVAEGRALIFPFQPEVESHQHQSSYYLSCIGDRHREPGRVEIPLKSEAVAWSERYWQQNVLIGKRVIAIAPGSGAQEKNWPAAFFLEVARWWRRQTSGSMLVILGSAEEEKGDYTTLCQEAIVARGLNLGQLSALLQRADLYLGNDSGVSHLAAALGVVTGVVFGPSNAARWAPLGENVTIFNRKTECSPCAVSVMKCCPHRKCLALLEPEYVISKLARLVTSP